ncbi:MAG TPA: helix-turn-helix domain-containing protein [Corynebacterium sp.]|nr:helix-turn-helix domain-containing protein [Corynebacterium sp.]
MSAWSEQLVSRFSASLRARREQLGLRVQDLADRTTEMGHPVSRSAITDYELGRRKDRLMLGDALALAEVLDLPLIDILADAGTPDERTENRISRDRDAIHERGREAAISKIVGLMRES